MKLIKKEVLSEQYTCWDISVKDTHCFFAEGVLTHNSNAGIVLTPDDSFYCQSRERIITPDSDNYGFSTFVNSWTEDDWKIIRSNFAPDVTISIYGEWAGGNIQGTVALKNLPKTFYPFAARIINDEEKEEWLDIRNWNFPNFIKKIYDFPTYKIEIDFEQSEYAVEQINKWVLEVEAECPVGKAQGIIGIGEGLVFSPTDPNYNSSRYWMKCKGSEHSKSKVKKLATVDIAKFESDKQFVESVLDEERLQQGYQWIVDNNGPADEKKTGEFIRWIFNDVLKEKKLEMEASNILEKDLGKLLSGPARKWYFAKINQ